MAPFSEALTVETPTGTIAIGPPQDLTGDGLYEDVDGDGDLDYDDALALTLIVRAHASGTLQLTDEQVAALDFDGGGALSPTDVDSLVRTIDAGGTGAEPPVDEIPPDPGFQVPGLGGPFSGPLTVDGGGRIVSIGPPRDLDGDGLYEDVDGDGGLDYDDVAAFSQLLGAYEAGTLALTDDQIAALDFGRDGSLDRADIGALVELLG